MSKIVYGQLARWQGANDFTEGAPGRASRHGLPGIYLNDHLAGAPASSSASGSAMPRPDSPGRQHGTGGQW